MPLPDLYAKMLVRFDEDPKVLALCQYGDDAGLCRDLFLAMVRYCKRNLSDGFVPAYEVMRLAMPLAMPDALRIAQHLASEELISQVSAGWFVTAYTRINGTRSETESRSERGRKAARRRWDGAGQGGEDAERTAGSNADGSAGWTPHRIADGIAEGNAKDKTRQETSRGRAPARGAARRGGTATPPPVSHVLAQSRRTGPPADPHEWAAKARAGLPAHEPSTTDTVTNADAPPNDPAPGPGDDPPLVDDPEAADEFPF